MDQKDSNLSLDTEETSPIPVPPPVASEYLPLSPDLNSNKGMLIIIILLILISVGLFFLFMKQNTDSQRVDSILSPLLSFLTPNSMNNLSVFSNPEYGYSFKYPEEMIISGDKEYADDLGVGEYIAVSVWEKDDTCEECNSEDITSTETVERGDHTFTRKSGIIRATTDIEDYYDPPQSFITYEITRGKLRYDFTIYEVPTDASSDYNVMTKYPPSRKPGPVPAKDLQVLEQMLSTLTFSQPKTTTVSMFEPENYNEFENTGTTWRDISLEKFNIGLPPGWKLLDDSQMITLTPPDEQEAVITIAGEIGIFPSLPNGQTSVTYESILVDGINAGLERKRSLYSTNESPTSTEKVTVQVRKYIGTWSFSLLRSEYEKEFFEILDTISFTEKKPYDSTKNLITVKSAYVGQRVGQLRITAITPYNPAFPKHEANAKITFSGRATITGSEYHYPFNQDKKGNLCFSLLDNASEDLLPKIKGDGTPIVICFTNSTAATKAFESYNKVSNKKPTIIIDTFTINRTPHEIHDTARFVEILTSGPTPSMSPVPVKNR